MTVKCLLPQGTWATLYMLVTIRATLSVRTDQKFIRLSVYDDRSRYIGLPVYEGFLSHPHYMP